MPDWISLESDNYIQIDTDDRSSSGVYNFQIEAEAEGVQLMSDFVIELVDPCATTTFEDIQL